MSGNFTCHCNRGAIAGLFSLLLTWTAGAPGLAQEPTDRAGWVKQIEAALEAGKDKDALATIAGAAKALPEDTSFRNPAVWFERHGEKAIKDKGWEAGFAVAERALKVLPANEQSSILAWRSSLYQFWSQELLRKKDVAGSLQVLAKGYKLHPNDRDVQAGIAFHAQEALAIAATKSVDAVIDEYQSLRKQFPKVEDLSRRGQRIAELAVSKLVEEKKFKEAVAAVDRYGPLLAKPEQRAAAGGMAFNGWAVHLAEEKKWEQALEKFAEGLKAYPDHALLLENALVIVERWAKPAVVAEKWDEAIRIYGVALKHFPNNPTLSEGKQRYEKLKSDKK
jgi:tetratricopeptide (TPR) repeat protein